MLQPAFPDRHVDFPDPVLREHLLPNYVHATFSRLSQPSISSLRANISSLLTGGGSLVDPADALRNAMVISAVLEYASEPESDEELAEVLELKVLCLLDVEDSNCASFTRSFEILGVLVL